MKDASTKMISVVHVIDTAGPGGAETIFLQTATRLNPARFRSIAVINEPGWLAERLRESGCEFHLIPAKGSFNVRYLAALLMLIRRCKADVVIAHLYGSAIYASLMGGILSIPVISVLHGQTDVTPSGRFAALKAAAMRRGSHKVVFVSERLQDDLASHLRLPVSQRLVIPNGVDTDVFRPSRNRSLRCELGLSNEAFLVGAIGNIRPPKAYDMFLRAARILLRRSNRFHFVVAGDNSSALGREMEELCREFGIEAHVTFLGSRSDVALLLNNFDVFVLSSTTEGFSIACIEAMACGVPVIATRSGGPEQILEGGAGVLVPTCDPEAIANAIETLVSSRELVDELIASGIKRVRQDFSLSRMLSRYEDLLSDVASKPSSVRGTAQPAP